MESNHAGPAFQTPGQPGDDLHAVRTIAEDCTRCDLYRHATHVVFGEGSPDADVVLVGEQPGDKEDLAARPFVGPAGRLLDRCLEEADVDRTRCYVTNAVKHFKFTPRGKRRIHAKPNAGETRACAWWLAAELRIIRPSLVVALGATALFSLLGKDAKVTRDGGRVLQAPDGLSVLVTIHPSALLRTMDRPESAQERQRFIDELRQIANYVS
ncbi:uracil-DNA glycosylase [Pseudorhizobium endolithicum]|uniref:Type-4 uracil-DNA glycosylase n=1 Tax=Pseudorhizobium endolithicum TaxID=1191678 RepID=A0ABN7JRR1_9HYPH|nr:UdgX family uracil-DNA binding protein [Pseudorhizobium endolithicum]CAD7039635.1 uracil-DNA glycosylase [Pseudorhizobium endolithicum]